MTDAAVADAAIGAARLALSRQEPPGLIARPDGRAPIHHRRRLRAPPRRIWRAVRGRAAQGGRDCVVGGIARRSVRKRRLSLRQEAAARDRPPAVASREGDESGQDRRSREPCATDEIRFGATVELADEEDMRRTVTIVGDDEADATHGRIGWSSPIARALVGAKSWRRTCGEPTRGREELRRSSRSVTRTP